MNETFIFLWLQTSPQWATTAAAAASQWRYMTQVQWSQRHNWIIWIYNCSYLKIDCLLKNIKKRLVDAWNLFVACCRVFSESNSSVDGHRQPVYVCYATRPDVCSNTASFPSGVCRHRSAARWHSRGWGNVEPICTVIPGLLPTYRNRGVNNNVWVFRGVSLTNFEHGFKRSNYIVNIVNFKIMWSVIVLDTNRRGKNECNYYITCSAKMWTLP